MAKTIECPNCGYESEEIDYTVDTSGWERGTVVADDRGNEDFESDEDEHEWDGSPKFKCRECDHNYINWQDVLNNELNRNNEENEDENELQPVIGETRIRNDGVIETFLGTPGAWLVTGRRGEGIFRMPPIREEQDPTSLDKPNAQTIGGYKSRPLLPNMWVNETNPVPLGTQCPKCNLTFIKDADEVDVMCPKCNYEFNVVETINNVRN